MLHARRSKPALTAVLLSSLLASCGSSPLVGKWDKPDRNLPVRLEFVSDGTAIINFGHNTDTEKWSAVEGNRVKLEGQGGALVYVCQYSVNGTQLTLSDCPMSSVGWLNGVYAKAE